jgi:hypothetical protein
MVIKKRNLMMTWSPYEKGAKNSPEKSYQQKSDRKIIFFAILLLYAKVFDL